MKASSTIAKNVIRWAIIGALGAVAIGTGWALLAGAGAYFGAGLMTMAAHGGGAALGFLKGSALLIGLLGAAGGSVLGVGAGIMEAKRNCDSPACETSLATEVEKLAGKEPSVNKTIGNGYATDLRDPNYAQLYNQMGVTPRSDHAQRLGNRASPVETAVPGR